MKLVAVAEGGGNAFFVQDNHAMPALDPVDAYRENALRNRWSGTTASEQWEILKELPLMRLS